MKCPYCSLRPVIDNMEFCVRPECARLWRAESLTPRAAEPVEEPDAEVSLAVGVDEGNGQVVLDVGVEGPQPVKLRLRFTPDETLEFCSVLARSAYVARTSAKQDEGLIVPRAAGKLIRLNGA